MTTGESFISIMLVIIAYLLYQIAKQLSYLSGRRIKISFFKWQIHKYYPKHRSKQEATPQERTKN